MGIPKIQRGQRARRNLRILGALLILALLIATFAVWQWYTSSINLTSSDRLDQIVDRNSRRIANQFEVYANILYSGRGLFFVTDTMNQQKWDTYFKAQDIGHRYPAVSSVDYASVVDRADIGSFLDQLQAQLPQGSNPVNLRPTSNKPQSVILTYYSSETDKSVIVGYDLNAEAMRAKALAEARDKNTARSSLPVVLASDIGTQRKSVVVVLPTYRTDAASLKSIDDRRSNIIGYTVMGIHIQQFLQEVYALGSLPASVHVDVAIEGEHIYSTGPTIQGAHLQKSMNINLSGKNWQFVYTSPQLLNISMAGVSAPYVVLVSGILLSLLLSITIYYATTPASTARKD